MNRRRAFPVRVRTMHTSTRGWNSTVIAGRLAWALAVGCAALFVDPMVAFAQRGPNRSGGGRMPMAAPSAVVRAPAPIGGATFRAPPIGGGAAVRVPPVSGGTAIRTPPVNAGAAAGVRAVPNVSAATRPTTANLRTNWQTATPAQLQ